jgi:hypothetical protein
MDAVDILKICLRRWYVMLPILLGAAGVSYQLVQSQETTYTAAASYGLVQPRLTSGADTGERNPLGTDDSDLVGAALEAQLNSRVTQQRLGSDATRGWGPGEADNGSSYAVKIPMFETTYEVRAWGSEEQEVQDVVDRVLEAAPGIADELQTRAGAPATVRYEPFVLAPTQVDALPATSAMKLVIAVMGVGVLVGAAWSIVADRLLRRRVSITAERAADAEPRRGPAPAAVPAKQAKPPEQTGRGRPAKPARQGKRPRRGGQAARARRAEEAKAGKPFLGVADGDTVRAGLARSTGTGPPRRDEPSFRR